ncbi:MAG: hypothetical protein WAU86_16820, partial [Oricola sp.]
FLRQIDRGMALTLTICFRWRKFWKLDFRYNFATLASPLAASGRRNKALPEKAKTGLSTDCGQSISRQ